VGCVQKTGSWWEVVGSTRNSTSGMDIPEVHGSMFGPGHSALGEQQKSWVSPLRLWPLFVCALLSAGVQSSWLRLGRRSWTCAAMSGSVVGYIFVLYLAITHSQVQALNTHIYAYTHIQWGPSLPPCCPHPYISLWGLGWTGSRMHLYLVRVDMWMCVDVCKCVWMCVIPQKI